MPADTLAAPFAQPLADGTAVAGSSADPLPLTTATTAIQATAQPLVAGTAGQVFAAALHAAAPPRSSASTEPAATSNTDHDTGATDPVIATLLAAAPVAAAAGATLRTAAVDLRHASWPSKMLDQIEALRDAADAVSTRIRIAPDMLGPVDLQVQRDGDRVHVHFNAANPETRALLADAQPQLAREAEDRGVRLGQTSVGAGGSGASGGGDRPGSAAPRAPTPRRPASAAASAAPDAATSTDTRIA